MRFTTRGRKKIGTTNTRNNLSFLSVITRSKILINIAACLAVIGTVVMLTGGIWDATSHSLRAPEYFWSIQHVAVYTGVSMIASSGIVGAILLKRNRNDLFGALPKGLKIIILGSIVQIAAGYGDSLSHDVFGIDGLVSFTHQPLEVGLVLSALGGFFVIRSLNDNGSADNSSYYCYYSRLHSALLPFSIVTLILSISWVCFNLSLLVGGTVLCIPVYQLFSSGCAIL